MDKNDVGIKLKRLREQRYLTQEEVAFKLQVSSVEYREYETGKRYPSDASLKLLLEVYNITEEEFERSDFIDYLSRKKIYRYIQLGVVLLLVLGYFLPFQEHTNTLPRILVSGFTMVFDDAIITGILFGLIFQAVLLVLVIRYDFSSVYESICVFLSLSSLVLMWAVFQGRLASGVDYSLGTLGIFIMLFLVNILVGVRDIIKHPIEHDYLDDLKKVRRVFLIIFNVILFVLYVSLIDILIFDDDYIMMFWEKVFLTIWTMYHLAYIGLLIFKRGLLETRLGSSIALGLPPVIFSIFYYGFIFFEQGEVDSMSNFIVLVFHIPVILVNLDYFSAMARGLFQSKV